MKTYIAIALLFACGLVSAQRRSQYNNPAIEREHAMQGRDKQLTPEQQLDTFLAQMTSEIGLNGLQEAAIRNILKDQMQQSNALKSSQQTDTDKQDEMRQVTEKTDKEIKALLDAAQLEKYEKFKQDMRSGKKIKKKKKKEESQEPHE